MRENYIRKDLVGLRRLIKREKEEKKERKRSIIHTCIQSNYDRMILTSVSNLILDRTPEQKRKRKDDTI